jgi:single-stranded DNA-binding protein
MSLKLMFSGFISGDAVVKYNDAGVPSISFSVPVNKRVPGKPGEEWVEKTFWVRVRASRKAEFAEKMIKGTRVQVIGDFTPSMYESKEDGTRMGLDVYADSIEIINKAAPGDSGGYAGPSARPAAQPVRRPAPVTVAEDEDGELPF